MGIVQGLTEYLPVSSSGHLAIISNFFGIKGEDSLMFTVAVHVATVLSTLVILWREIDWIMKGLFKAVSKRGQNQVDLSSAEQEQARPKVKFQMNEETKYLLNIIVSMIPVGIVGLFFKDKVEEAFGSGLLVVGVMLIVTAVLLIFSYYAKPRPKEHISLWDAFVIGVAQACAVLPGLSRSGSTIATGLMLGNKKEKLAQFSFLMVIPPILGEALLDILKAAKGEAVMGDIGVFPLCVGFLAAFLSGCFACKLMINVVKKGKLVYFGIYCAVVGVMVLAYQLTR